MYFDIIFSHFSRHSLIKNFMSLVYAANATATRSAAYSNDAADTAPATAAAPFLKNAKDDIAQIDEKPIAVQI